MKYVTSFVILLFLITFISPVHALTQQDIDILIRAGLISPDKVGLARSAAARSSTNANSSSNANVSDVQTTNQSQTVSETTTNTAVGTDTSGCLKINSDLFQGVSGSAVSSLQRFLKEQGHFDFPEITGFYGDVTRQAVESFQQAQDIVSEGSSQTTGFGLVGPKTRDIIETISCLGGGTPNTNPDGEEDSGDFLFGYDLDELFNYEPDLDYDGDLGYNPDFDYEPDFDYQLEDFDGIDFNYDPNFDYDVNEGAFGFGPDLEMTFEVLDSNGNYVEGQRGRRFIEVATRTIEVRWESKNASGCNLSGDFPERNIPIPAKGSASIFLVNPSYSVPVGNEPVFYGIYQSKPGFGIRMGCIQNGLYGQSASDNIIVHIKDPATSTSSVTSN